MSEKNQIELKFFLFVSPSLHGHFSGVHFLISFLKTVREEQFFISLSNRFHDLAPKFETLSIPYCVARMFFRSK